MELKKIPKTVMVDLFITADGKEFDSEDEALLHETKIKFKNVYGDIDNDLENGDHVYIIIPNEEEVETLSYYIEEVLGQNCDMVFNIDTKTYPLLVCYDDEGRLNCVEREDYLQYKKICSMYEQATKVNQMEDL
jgi:hypothetical protein